MPNSFNDELRKTQIAKQLTEKFDCHVLTLQKLCNLLIKAQPTTPAEVQEILDKQFNLSKQSALSGWKDFCKSVEEALGVESKLPEGSWLVVINRLLREPQESNDIVEILEGCGPNLKRLTDRDIGLANACASYHPLAIDPFERGLRLSGKVVAAALSEKVRNSAV